jgi:hypothetical protein
MDSFRAGGGRYFSGPFPFEVTESPLYPLESFLLRDDFKGAEWFYPPIPEDYQKK